MKYEIKNNYLCIKIQDNLNNQNLNALLNLIGFNSKNKNFLITNKYISRKNEILNANSILYKRDIIKILLYLPKNDKLSPYNSFLDVVYEDELFLIVNKPNGILVHPDTNNNTKTLANIVANYYLNNNYNISVRPIHRLDIETSGLIIFSKSEFFQPILDKMLQEKKISRYYYALVEGFIEPNSELTIDKPIGKNRHKSNQYIVYANGKKSTTHVKAISYDNESNTTLVECKLDTGRTHQIRVHLSSINHPIINDSIYFKKSNLTNSLALQAYKIKFFHPLLEEYITIKIKLNLK